MSYKEEDACHMRRRYEEEDVCVRVCACVYLRGKRDLLWRQKRPTNRGVCVRVSTSFGI